MIFAYGRSGSALGPHVTGPWQKQSQRVLFTDFFLFCKKCKNTPGRVSSLVKSEKSYKNATVTLFSKTATTSHPKSYKEEQTAT